MGYRFNSYVSSGDPLRERPARVESYTVRGRETRDDFVSLLFEYATENGITSSKRQVPCSATHFQTAPRCFRTNNARQNSLDFRYIVGAVREGDTLGMESPVGFFA